MNVSWDQNGYYNVSKTVGWQVADKPVIPPVATVQKFIDQANTGDPYELMASAWALLTLWRYSPPPETEEELQTIKLLASAYPTIRKRAEAISKDALISVKIATSVQS